MTWETARYIMTVAQATTFIGLAVVMFAQHDWRLAFAQVMLAVITVLVYL